MQVQCLQKQAIIIRKVQYSYLDWAIVFHGLTLLVMIYSTEQRVGLVEEYPLESFDSVYMQ